MVKVFEKMVKHFVIPVHITPSSVKLLPKADKPLEKSVNYLLVKKYKDFIPRKEADLLVYATTYKTTFRKLAKLAIPFLDNQGIEAHEAKVQAMIDVIRQVDSKKAELAGLVSKKNSIVDETVTAIRRMAMYAKKGEAGNSAEVLSGGLTCRAVRLDVKELQPKLRIKSLPQYVEIAFNKHHILSIELYCRNVGENDWELLGYASETPYQDTRPVAQPGKPELREYRACYTNLKTSISQFSNVVSTVAVTNLTVIAEE